MSILQSTTHPGALQDRRSDILRLLLASKIVEEPPTSSTAKTAFNDGPGMIIGDDLKEYTAKLTEGKSAVIRHLRDLMLSRVEFLKNISNSRNVSIRKNNQKIMGRQ